MEVRGSLKHPQLKVSVNDASQIGEARRAAIRLATTAGADETRAGKFAIVTTELATNLVRHAKGGELLFQVLDFLPGAALEVIAIDKGPGMASVEQCMSDGYSTGGTNGNGLGAVSRQSNEFDIYSSPGHGTVVMSRIWVDRFAAWETADKHRAACGMVCMPHPHEIECGDTWRVSLSADRCSCIVADGLGHGVQAAEAAQAAARAFEGEPLDAPASILQKANVQMRGTRGAAVAIGQIDFNNQKVRYAGVGNIAGTVLSSDTSRGLFSHNGIVGHNAHRIQELEYPWNGDTMLVMCSDGLQSRWQIGAYSGLRRRHPAIIAAVLYRDFQRGRDDVTVLVVSPRGGWICSRN